MTSQTHDRPLTEVNEELSLAESRAQRRQRARFHFVVIKDGSQCKGSIEFGMGVNLVERVLNLIKEKQIHITWAPR